MAPCEGSFSVARKVVEALGLVPVTRREGWNGGERRHCHHPCSDVAGSCNVDVGRAPDARAPLSSAPTTSIAEVKESNGGAGRRLQIAHVRRARVAAVLPLRRRESRAAKASCTADKLAATSGIGALMVAGLACAPDVIEGGGGGEWRRWRRSPMTRLTGGGGARRPSDAASVI